MSNTIIELRHSYVTGNVPSSLANGEIAINTFDGKLFYRGGVSNTIQTIERYEGPAGLDGEVQFNDSGVLGSSDKLTFNKSTGLLRTTNLTASNVTTQTFIQFGDGSKQYTANAGTGGTSSGIWTNENDFGLVTDAVTTQSDLGSVTDSPTENYDLGGIGVSGVVTNDSIANNTITGNKLTSDININTTGNITANIVNVNSQLNMTGNIIPTANATYDLGSPTNVWRDLYLSDSTIYLGNALISASGENLVLPSTVQIGEATISSLGSDVVLSDNVHIGQATISSLGSDVVLPANVHIGETLLSSHGGSLVLPEITFSTLDISGNVTAGNISTTGALSAADARFSGNVAAMSINPIESSAHDLGTANLRWRTVYTSDLDLNNGIGDWTIVEGEEDLFLYNNKKNKVYKFALIEVSPEQATPKIDGLK
jgi:hypothetical protein